MMIHVFVASTSQPSVFQNVAAIVERIGNKLYSKKIEPYTAIKLSAGKEGGFDLWEWEHACWTNGIRAHGWMIYGWHAFAAGIKNKVVESFLSFVYLL